MKTFAHIGLILSLASMPVFAFPEMPFCPFGGAPGWANRFLGDRYESVYAKYHLPKVSG